MNDSTTFWESFFDEMTKLSGKARYKVMVPSPLGGGGQNFGKFTKSPGVTKTTGEARTVSQSGSMITSGRTGSVTDVPTPPPVR